MDFKFPVFANIDHPMILGHRGVTLEHQENTLAGFQRAAELGIDGVELDVLLSQDNQLVVFHDDTLERLTSHSGSITELSWEQISELDVQPLINVGDREIDYGKKQKICLLEHVLEEIGDKLIINIELKGPSAKTGTHVAKLVTRMNLISSVFVSSFDLPPLYALRRESKEIASGFALSKPGSWLDATKQRFYRSYPTSKLVGAGLSSMNIDIINQRSVDKHHRVGCAIGAWTLFAQDSQYFALENNETAQIEKLKQLTDWGIDFLITDDPVKAQSLIQSKT